MPTTPKPDAKKRKWPTAWKLEQIRKKLNEIIKGLNEEVLKNKNDEYEHVILEMNEEFDW